MATINDLKEIHEYIQKAQRNLQGGEIPYLINKLSTVKIQDELFEFLKDHKINLQYNLEEILTLSIVCENLFVIDCIINQIKALKISQGKLNILHVSAFLGKVNFYNYLSKNNFQDYVNIQDHNGRTPLFWAIQSKNNDICLKLVKQFAIDINAIDNYHENALFWAVRKKMYNVVKVLIENGISTNQINVYGQDVHTVVQSNDDTQIKQYFQSTVQTLKESQRVQRYDSICITDDLNNSQIKNKKVADINTIQNDDQIKDHKQVECKSEQEEMRSFIADLKYPQQQYARPKQIKRQQLAWIVFFGALISRYVYNQTIDPDFNFYTLMGGMKFDGQNLVSSQIYITVLTTIQVLVLIGMMYNYGYRVITLRKKPRHVLNLSNVWELSTYLLQVLSLQQELVSVNVSYQCQMALCYTILQANVFYLIQFVNQKLQKKVNPNFSQVEINKSQYLFQQTQMSVWQLVQFVVLVIINFISQAQKIASQNSDGVKVPLLSKIMLAVNALMILLIASTILFKVFFTKKLEEGFSQWLFYSKRELIKSEFRQYPLSYFINLAFIFFGFVIFFCMLILLLAQHIIGLNWNANLRDFTSIIKKCDIDGFDQYRTMSKYLDSQQKIGDKSFKPEEVFSYPFKLTMNQMSSQYGTIPEQTRDQVLNLYKLDLKNDYEIAKDLTLPNIYIYNGTQQTPIFTYSNKSVSSSFTLAKQIQCTLSSPNNGNWNDDTQIQWPKDQTGLPDSVVKFHPIRYNDRQQSYVLYDLDTTSSSINNKQEINVTQGINNKRNLTYAKYNVDYMIYSPYQSASAFVNQDPIVVQSKALEDKIYFFGAKTIICGGYNCADRSQESIWASVLAWAHSSEIKEGGMGYAGYLFENYDIGNNQFITVINVQSIKQPKDQYKEIQIPKLSSFLLFHEAFEANDNSIQTCFKERAKQYAYYEIGAIQYGGQQVFQMGQLICWGIMLVLLVLFVVLRRRFHDSIKLVSNQMFVVPTSQLID